MNLIVDQGNSICKLAIYEDGRVLWSTSVVALNEAILREVFAHNQIDSAIYSSVGVRCEHILEILKGHCALVIDLDASTPVPIEVLYDRSRLGSDRLAAVVGAYAQTLGKRSCLVIDAGTAVTYEYLDAEGRYLGGNIAPGLWLRFKALASFTSKLPLIEDLPEETLPLYGTDTHSAMMSGCTHGFIREVQGAIDDILRSQADALILLTGGDSELLCKHCQSENIRLIPNLVFDGLNRILEYNKELRIKTNHED